MAGSTKELHGELLELATSLLSQIEQYVGNDNVDKQTRSSIVRNAQEIIKKVGRIPEEQMLEDCIKAAEMVSKHLFSLWGAFEAIPNEGSISLEDLAGSIKCDVKLLSKGSLSLSSLSSGSVMDGTNLLFSPICAHASLNRHSEARESWPRGAH